MVLIDQVRLHKFFRLECEDLFLFFLEEYFSRFCLPSGDWSNFSLVSCFYPDVLALLETSYTRRPLEEREVCLNNFPLIE